MTKKGRLHASGGKMSDVVRPSHAEGVKTLLHGQSVGTLCTHSACFDGYPFGSMMPYALDAKDRPLILISSMAVHTQNLLNNSKASLYVGERVVEGEVLGTARLTLMGDVQQVEGDEIRHCYLKAHANAKQWVDFDDFSFYRMDVSNVYYVGGFGVMGWVSQDEFAQAAPDPLMEIADEVIQHMNDDHADALILLASDQSGVDADEVRMVAVDRLGFDVKVRVGEQLRGVRIAFPSSVDDAANVRAMFVTMVKQARAALGSSLGA